VKTFLACPDPTCNMTYHGGDLVLGPHTTHVVYWEPTGFSVTPNYHPLIERYFTDVAADSGGSPTSTRPTRSTATRAATSSSTSRRSPAR
jgi:hypothetical protein